MVWQDTSLRILRTEFRNRIFSTHEAFSVLKAKRGYSKGTVHRVLHDLVKQGLLERLGRGIYKNRGGKIIELKDRLALTDKVIVELIPGPLIKAKKLLKRKGIEFMVTGSSLLHKYIHHLPKRLIHLVYVVKGAGEPTVIVLREDKLRALLEPTSDEIIQALENFPERDIFVVREFSELLGNIGGSACIERALVDLYFETTRKKIPFPIEEAGRIFLKVFRSELISLSRLFRFARRRGIREEMIAIAEFIEPELYTSVEARSNHVKNFLYVLGNVDLR